MSLPGQKHPQLGFLGHTPSNGNMISLSPFYGCRAANRHKRVSQWRRQQLYIHKSVVSPFGRFALTVTDVKPLPQVEDGRPTHRLAPLSWATKVRGNERRQPKQ
eukprot:s1330_g9.t1